MDDFDCDENYSRPSFPLTRQALGAIAASAVGNVLDAAATFFDDLSMTLAADHNYRIDRKSFHEQAALEIETLARHLEG